MSKLKNLPPKERKRLAEATGLAYYLKGRVPDDVIIRVTGLSAKDRRFLESLGESEIFTLIQESSKRVAETVTSTASGYRPK